MLSRPKTPHKTMNSQDIDLVPHRRRNPLTGQWVLVSPHRLARPWQGRLEATAGPQRPAYDPTCYLCPGNARVGGEVNPTYQQTYIFANDFQALLQDVPTLGDADPLFARQSVAGQCRVICYSPRHDLSLGQMDRAAIRGVVDLWAAQMAELGQQFKWVQIFENKGELMGCSNPHPHGQIWALDALPSEAALEDRHQADYRQQTGRVLLVDVVQRELADGARLVLSNEHWAVVVPFWAIWPFETLVLPRRHVARLTDLSDAERDSLADLLKRLLTKYDGLFDTSFPYSLGWHNAPYVPGAEVHWQLHGHLYPPLLRSATVRKFMVGFELLAEAQRDLTPEHAAQRLRELPDLVGA